eukprot:354050-Chlamydomonas_euryale.AAC.9
MLTQGQSRAHGPSQAHRITIKERPRGRAPPSPGATTRETNASGGAALPRCKTKQEASTVEKPAGALAVTRAPRTCRSPSSP